MKMKNKVFWLCLLGLCISAFVLFSLVSQRLQGGQLRLPQPGESTPVEETPAPVSADIRLLGDAEVLLDYGESYEDPGAEAWIVKADGEKESIEVFPTAGVDTARIGTTEIEYCAVKDGEKLASVSRRVTVRDIEPPVITMLDEPGERDYTALDNADGDLTAAVQRVELDDRFVYTVSDASGNETRAERMKQLVNDIKNDDR